MLKNKWVFFLFAIASLNVASIGFADDACQSCESQEVNTSAETADSTEEKEESKA